MQNLNEVVLGLGDFNGHLGRWVDGFENAHSGIKLAKEMLREEDYSSFVIKKVVRSKYMVSKEGAEKNNIQYGYN